MKNIITIVLLLLCNVLSFAQNNEKKNFETKSMFEVQIDSKKYKGFAFGFGLTRLVMMKYEIDDIRLISSSKVDFLSQF